MNTLLYLGIIFVLGAFTEWLSPKLHLSKVVGYMILGLLIAPGTFGVMPQHFVDNVHIVIDLALSLIAVLVGASLKWSELKGMTAQILTITFFQAFFAFATVCMGFYLFSTLLFPSLQTPLIVALLLGGIASATAPAATLAIIQELKAYGKFSTILLTVVAFDDAMALMLFAFALTMSATILGSGGIDFSGLLEAVIVIAGSVTVGLFAGLLTTGLEKLFSHHKGMETIATLGIVFITYSVSQRYGFEPLLATLVMGAVLTNLSADFDLVEEEVDNHIVEIVFMLFFILSAMHLELSALLSLPAAVVAYVLLRMIGKVGGTYVGGRISGADDDVQRYLGMALVPQAGVAIGLALSIQDHSGFESFAPTILNIVIATTIIHELIGPFMTRYALIRAKENHDE
ncbi:MAG: cation:proton antiporter [Campylobacterota bacterium]|nr:cation:proton antiporter [Campylobacterota bacterium]